MATTPGKATADAARGTVAGMCKTVPARLVIVLVCAFLSGCLPMARTQEGMQLNGYLGGPISAMVQDRGAPTLSGRGEDGSWTYVWRGCRVVTDWHGRDWSRYCEITARSDSRGIMTHWNWWGNECPLEGVSSGCGGLMWWQP